MCSIGGLRRQVSSNGTVSGQAYIGGLVGYLSCLNIDNCSNYDGTVASASYLVDSLVI